MHSGVKVVVMNEPGATDCEDVCSVLVNKILPLLEEIVQAFRPITTTYPMKFIEVEKAHVYSVLYGVAGDGQGVPYYPEYVQEMAECVSAFSAEDAETRMRIRLSSVHSNESYRILDIAPYVELSKS